MARTPSRASSKLSCSPQHFDCRLGAPYQAFGLLTLSLLAIFSTHYTADVTRAFVFADLDVAEAQCVLACALALTGYCGQEIWHQKLMLGISPATLVSLVLRERLFSAIVVRC